MASTYTLHGNCEKRSPRSGRMSSYQALRARRSSAVASDIQTTGSFTVF